MRLAPRSRAFRLFPARTLQAGLCLLGLGLLTPGCESLEQATSCEAGIAANADALTGSVDALVALAPEHASIYLLEIYPNAPLRDEMARGGWSVAPDEVAAEMYLQGLSRLEAAGYEQYEISNVARPGRRARHNLLYWQSGHWLGLGCGAHSTWDGVRWRNLSSTAEYVERMTAGRRVRVEARTLSAEERLEEVLFMGLRLTEGIDLQAVAARYGVDVFARHEDQLSRFVELGVLVHEPGRRLALTREGMLVANEIMMVFIGGTVR